jgi:GTP cyclohydrolase I
VTTLIRWASANPDREGLITARRVIRAYEEPFGGYGGDPDELLARTFEKLARYDEMTLLRDIRFALGAPRPSSDGPVSAICRATALSVSPK